MGKEHWPVITPARWSIVNQLPGCQNGKSISLRPNACFWNPHQNDNQFPFEPVVGVITNHHYTYRANESAKHVPSL